MDKKPPQGDKGTGQGFVKKGPVKKSGGVVSRAEIIVGIILFLILFISIFSTFDFSTGPLASIAGSVSELIITIKTILTIISMIALFIAVYSFIRISEISKEEKKKLGLVLNWESERNQKNTRWQRVEEYMSSSNSSDWKVAILEADNILDEITKRMGYTGETLGERMKVISATDFPYLEEAWEAHKVRNQLAHKGTEYALARSDAEHVINIYYRIFSALGYL